MARAPPGDVRTLPNPTTTTTKTSGTKTGWEKTCDCGFMVRDYNKDELVKVVNLHATTSHNMKPLTEREVLADVKTVKM